MIAVPRDRNGSFEPQVVEKYQPNTNELEEKILGLYAKGVSTRDIEEALADLYGVSVSASTVSKVTDKGTAASAGLAEPTLSRHLSYHLP